MWENLKFKILLETISFSKCKATQSRNYERFLIFVFHEKLFKAGVFYVKDIFSGNNRPLTFKLFCEK